MIENIKPFYTCKNPVRVVNPYTGKVLYTSCRKCTACLAKRAFELKKNLQDTLVNTEYSYLLFVTLKYNPENLPVAKVVAIEDFKKSSLYYGNSTKRLYLNNYSVGPDNKPTYFIPNSTLEFGSISPIEKSKLKYIAIHPDAFNIDFDKKNAPRFERFIQPMYNDSSWQTPQNHINSSSMEFGVLSYMDFQKFLKKLRFHLSSNKINLQSYERKIKYAVCGEYGPETLRPHYHCIIALRSQKALECARACISSCWSYGNTDTKVCNAKTAQYVAGYITCNQFLPETYRHGAFRPFFRKSASFSPADSPQCREEIFQNVRRGNYYLDDVRFNSDRTIREVSHLPLPSYVKNRFFVKPRGFTLVSDSDNLITYQYIYNLVAIKGKTLDYAKDCMKRETLKVYKHGLGVIPRYVYQDIRSSVLCFEFCVRFNIIPFDYYHLIKGMYVSHSSYYLKEQMSVVGDYYYYNNRLSYLFLDIDLCKDLFTSLEKELSQNAYDVIEAKLSAINLSYCDFLDNKDLLLFDSISYNKCLYLDSIFQSLLKTKKKKAYIEKKKYFWLLKTRRLSRRVKISDLLTI